MASRQWLARADQMASHWRRRPLCLLLADRPLPVALREVSGAGALIETWARFDVGTKVTLRHPDAGTVSAEVAGHDKEGLRLTFDRGEAAVSFALAAITSDMSQPG